VKQSRNDEFNRESFSALSSGTNLKSKEHIESKNQSSRIKLEADIASQNVDIMPAVLDRD
jgi:hypothetical protein